MSDHRIENHRVIEYIQRTYERDLQYQQRLLELTVCSIDQIERQDLLILLSSHFGRTVYVLFLKGFNGYWASLLLLKQGFSYEALVVIRSLYNLVINLLWISKKDQEARAERFVAFDIVHKKHIYDTVISYSPNLPRKPDTYEIEQQYQRIKTKLNLKGDPRKDKWSGKTIRQMAIEVGQKKSYDIIYSHLSDIEHSGASSLTRFVQFPRNDDTILQPGPSLEWINVAFMLNVNYYYILLKQVNKWINLKIDFDKIKNEFKSLYSINPDEP